MDQEKYKGGRSMTGKELKEFKKVKRNLEQMIEESEKYGVTHPEGFIARCKLVLEGLEVIERGQYERA